jgi:hypothetical protein
MREAMVWILVGFLCILAACGVVGLSKHSRAIDALKNENITLFQKVVVVEEAVRAATFRLDDYGGRVVDLESELSQAQFDIAQVKKHAHGHSRVLNRPFPAFPRSSQLVAK